MIFDLLLNCFIILTSVIGLIKASLKLIIIFIMISKSLSTVTWSSKPNGTLLYQTETYLYSSVSDVRSYNIQFGPISSSQYLLDYINSYSITVIVNEFTNGTILWAKSHSVSPSIFSLAISYDEQYVYFSLNQNPLSIIQLSSSSGGITAINQM